jgi:hypothetical protein
MADIFHNISELSKNLKKAQIVHVHGGKACKDVSFSVKAAVKYY